MNAIRVCKLLSVSLLTGASLTSLYPACAQMNETDGTRVLVVNREVTKPGKDGAVHEATEASFLRAMQANKANVHYIALTSLSGQNRALFISAYPSMAAVEAERKGLSAAALASMDKAMVADGDVLSEQTTTVWFRRDDLSTNVAGPPAGMRYLEVSEYVVKPGHVREFEDLGKMYVEAAKNIPEFHWTTYELAYGNGEAPTYVVLTAIKSASEIDAEFTAGKKFDEAMGEDGHKKMAELEAASVHSESTNLFLVNPKMSAPPDSMVKAEPDFWRPKSGPVSAKKTSTAPKSATATGQ